MAKVKVIQAVMYTNPDWLPPFINSTRLLSRAGYHVQLLCRNRHTRWGVMYPKEAKIIRIGNQKGMSWQEYPLFIFQVLRRSNKSACVVIGHDMHGFLPAKLLSTLYRRPLVYHCHDFVMRGQHISALAKIVQAFEHRFARTADLVIVPDADRGRVVGEELHLKRAPLIVANAPLKRPALVDPILGKSLAQQGRHYSKILLRQGILGPGHGIELTIRSIPHWNNKEWGFVLIGFAESHYTEKLYTLAEELGVATQLAILPPVPYDDVVRYTVGADAGHALYEPTNINHVQMGTASNKIMEYMASGIPFLVARSPSWDRLIAKYQCGIAVEVADPVSIANGVNTLLGDPDCAKRMGAAGKEAFEETFSYERQFEPVLSAITKLANRRYKD